VASVAFVTVTLPVGVIVRSSFAATFYIVVSAPEMVAAAIGTAASMNAEA